VDMANHRLSGPRVSALESLDLLGAAGVNDTCHGNKDGVDSNDKAILAHVRVMVICWGRFYKDNPDAVSSAFALCRDLVTGPYFNGLAQYGVGRGSMAGIKTIDDTFPPPILNEEGVRARIMSFVGNSVPGPAMDETSLLYVLFPPPQTTLTISSGKGFCGYHKSAKFHFESQHDDLFYAVIRTDTKLPIAGEELIKRVSYCVSHEINEAVTSRDGRGYHKGSCEIGDLCEADSSGKIFTYPYRGWNVERYLVGVGSLLHPR
jgi:hypothetical protein